MEDIPTAEMQYRASRNLRYAVATTANEIQKEALDLPQDQRAYLIADLIGSLPAVLADFDDGTAEAWRTEARSVGR